MGLFDWLVGRRAGVVLRCPRCDSSAATRKEAIVEVHADGWETHAGDGYGCPHCGLLWGVEGGKVFMYGDRRKVAPPPAAEPQPERDQEQLDRVMKADADLPWRGR